MTAAHTMLVLHGSYGNPFENWFSWIANEAGDLGMRCFVPHFPSPEGQDFETWAAILDAYFRTGTVTNGATVIAHSSGCSFAVRFLAERRYNVRTLVTVSGFDHFKAGDPAFDTINERMFTRSADDYKYVRDHVARRICFFSPDDPYLPLAKLSEFSRNLSATEVSVSEAGHFNEESGFTTFPELLTHVVE